MEAAIESGEQTISVFNMTVKGSVNVSSPDMVDAVGATAIEDHGVVDVRGDYVLDAASGVYFFRITVGGETVASVPSVLGSGSACFVLEPAVQKVR